ncbi:MAG: methylmalonyl Co-A mutase-associated GTPase MeaB [Betaproteobacteria bacterium]
MFPDVTMKGGEPHGHAVAGAPAETIARIAAILSGHRAAIARAITEIENDMPDARVLSEALAGHLGRAHIVGITGPPGAGKSTLINALLVEYAARGKRVAVAAVDPSSPITGGAILGDRIRMNEAGAADSAFIRSLASRGHPGGLARTTRRIADLFDAAGFDVVIVETVGAGQSEVAIGALADSSVVVCPPGLGDDVQALKAGILEIADLLVVNKGDQPHADRTEREMKEMLHLRAHRDGWKVPVLRTTATSGSGVARLVDALAAHAAADGIGRRLRKVPEKLAGDPGADVARFIAADPCMQQHGIELVAAASGIVTLQMRVQPWQVNFNGSCHGGALFTLADSAFGLAANSYGVVAAGINAHLTFQVAVREGDLITAHATEVSRSAKLAVYVVDVTRDGTTVSTFTGSVFVTRRAHGPMAALSP